MLICEIRIAFFLMRGNALFMYVMPLFKYLCAYNSPGLYESQSFDCLTHFCPLYGSWTNKSSFPSRLASKSGRYMKNYDLLAASTNANVIPLFFILVIISIYTYHKGQVVDHRPIVGESVLDQLVRRWASSPRPFFPGGLISSGRIQKCLPLKTSRKPAWLRII